jgi:putative phosphoribosyl transferase
LKIIETNNKTINRLKNVDDKKLEIVNGASHLFEEEGKIEEVGNVAANWLKENLR